MGPEGKFRHRIDTLVFLLLELDLPSMRNFISLKTYPVSQQAKAREPAEGAISTKKNLGGANGLSSTAYNSLSAYTQLIRLVARTIITYLYV